MSELSTHLTALDKLIHESARLTIMTALEACASADFLYLRRVTGLSGGNLSSHLSKLEEAGLLSIEKRFVGKKPNTLVTLTPLGRESISRHWAALDAMRADAQNLKPTK